MKKKNYLNTLNFGISFCVWLCIRVSYLAVSLRLGHLTQARTARLQIPTDTYTWTLSSIINQCHTYWSYFSLVICDSLNIDHVPWCKRIKSGVKGTCYIMMSNQQIIILLSFISDVISRRNTELYQKKRVNPSHKPRPVWRPESLTKSTHIHIHTQRPWCTHTRSHPHGHHTGALL